MKRITLCLALVFATVSMAMGQTSSVPPLVNYQGRLTDATGAGINGSRNLTFNIYDSEQGAKSGVAAVWGPQVFAGVPLIDGHFNVILGTTDSAGRSILDAFSSNQRYLGITVDGGEEIAPLQQILSTPYAVKAADAHQLAGEMPRWWVPVGSVVAFFGSDPPDGWLICDGTSVDQLGEDRYSKLVQHLTNIGMSSLPDLRGRIIVGAGTGTDTPTGGQSRSPETRTFDLGEIAGEYQHGLSISEMPRHWHNLNSTYNRVPRQGGGDGTPGSTDSSSSEINCKRFLKFQGEGGNSPHNNIQPYQVLNYIIKY